MSITDELRDYARHLHNVWYDPRGNVYTYTTMDNAPSLDAVRLDEHVLAIADRIDAECERQLEALYHDMSDDEYIELPKDADGKPIHIGDVLAPPADCDDYVPLQVTSLTYDGYEKEWFFDGEAGGFCGLAGQHMDVAGWTHYRKHKQRTVEDVLEQFAVEVERAGGVFEVADDVWTSFAAKLRLAEEVD